MTKRRGFASPAFVKPLSVLEEPLIGILTMPLTVTQASRTPDARYSEETRQLRRQLDCELTAALVSRVLRAEADEDLAKRGVDMKARIAHAVAAL
jgi:hypothetical protein